MLYETMIPLEIPFPDRGGGRLDAALTSVKREVGYLGWNGEIVYVGFRWYTHRAITVVPVYKILRLLARALVRNCWLERGFVLACDTCVILPAGSLEPHLQLSVRTE